MQQNYLFGHSKNKISVAKESTQYNSTALSSRSCYWFRIRGFDFLNYQPKRAGQVTRSFETVCPVDAPTELASSQELGLYKTSFHRTQGGDNYQEISRKKRQLVTESPASCPENRIATLPPAELCARKACPCLPLVQGRTLEPACRLCHYVPGQPWVHYFTSSYFSFCLGWPDIPF